MPAKNPPRKSCTACSPSVLFDALADRRRRSVLRYLAGAETPVFVDELAAYLADQEDTPDKREIIQAMLLHHHLPKLADAELVWFDRETDIVTEGPTASHAADHLSLIADLEGQ